MIETRQLLRIVAIIESVHNSSGLRGQLLHIVAIVETVHNGSGLRGGDIVIHHQSCKRSRGNVWGHATLGG